MSDTSISKFFNASKISRQIIEQCRPVSVRYSFLPTCSVWLKPTTSVSVDLDATVGCVGNNSSAARVKLRRRATASKI